MTKKEKMNKILSKIISVVGIVSVLLLSFVLPSSAYVNVGLDNQSIYSLQAAYPVSSFSVSTKGYGVDSDSEEGDTYLYYDTVYNLFIPTRINVDYDLTDFLTEMRADTELDYSGLILYSFDSRNYSSVSGSLSENISGFEYGLYHMLTYSKNWFQQSQSNPYNPKLPFHSEFTTYNYNGRKLGFEFDSDKNDSIVVHFNEYIVYDKSYNRPYIQFDDYYFPLGVSNYDCYVTYDYDLVTVESVGGEPTLNTQHVSNTVLASSSWNSQKRVHTVPYFNSNQVIKNLVTKVNFKTNSQTVKTWVPSNFVYVQPFTRELNNDPFEYLDQFNTVVKWHDISDITAWIGETVADFFDIELFPGIRLSVVLGIVITVSVTTWVLKLMAGG